jgi:SET domain-containing protein
MNTIELGPINYMQDDKGRNTKELIEVRRSKVHGLGVFAKRALRAGTDLGAYEGRRYSLKQAMRMRWDGTRTYLFETSDGTIIDGGRGGSDIRHMNHACDPNCEAREVQLPDGTQTIRFRTTTAIAADEELFLDYQLGAYEDEDPAKYQCLCGAKKCRGTLLTAPA